MSFASDISDLLGRLGLGGSSPAAPPPGSPYSALYVFGDSLSDAGNDYAFTLGHVPVSPPYSDGRFTNGPVWAQDLGSQLGLSVKPSLIGGTDFAYGGAETGPTPSHQATPIDLNAQLLQFQAQDPQPPANALYAVWIGSNDVLDALAHGGGDTIANVQAAVGNEMQFLYGLVGEGARDLLVLNVPDLGKVPDVAAEGPAYAAQASSLSSYYDTLLANDLAAFEVTNPAVNITSVDTFSLLDEAASDPAAFGFSNVTTPLWSGNLTDPQSGTLATPDPQGQAGYLFFDGLHPTVQGHAAIADAVAQHLAVA
jgi:phospholipase/lecithinase/hemolysin